MDFLRTYTNFSSNQNRYNNITTAGATAELSWVVRLSLCISGLFIICMSFITVPANGLLFLTLWKDPLKSLRVRSSFFVMSLSLANFLVGLAVEPTYGFSYFYQGYQGESSPTAEVLHNLGRTFAALANNSSFFTVCALAIDHYFAISRPIEYRAEAQKGTRSVFIVIGFIWVYSAAFSLLPFIGVSEDVFFKIDLHMNSFLTLVLLFASYIAFAKSYGKRSVVPRRQEADMAVRRDSALLGVIFLLIIIASLTALPIIAYWHVYDYCLGCRADEGFQLLSRVLECLFYMKFAADPFLYAWRLPRYRKAFILMLPCKTTTR